MRLMPVIKNLTEPEEKQFREYLDEKLKRFKPMIESHYPDEDAVKLDARIRKHERHSAFEIELMFDMPKAKFMSKEVKHTITEAMDLATDRIEQQMVKHFKKKAKE